MNQCQQCKNLSESLFFCRPECQDQYFSSDKGEEEEAKTTMDEIKEAEPDIPVMMMRPENGRVSK